MSKPKEPLPGKLLISAIFKEESVVQECWKTLETIWGPIEFLSEKQPFDYTGYYEKEMGRPLFRRWSTFRNLISQDHLGEIKWQALELENQWLIEGKRQVNLDPGLITAERLVLTTGKNFSHRIYLGKGIFADLTLVFIKGSFQPLPWTYPDYQEARAILMFNKIRERYLKEIKKV